MCYNNDMPDEQNELVPQTNVLNPEHGAVLERPETMAEQPERQPLSQETVAPAEPIAPSTIHHPPPTSASIAPSKDPLLADLEGILSEGLGEVYGALPDAKKAAFRAKGEQVATSIQQMVARGRLKVHDIWKAIRDWLRMIPGINRFFLEQEAKIKTDKIVDYARSTRQKSPNAL